MKVIINNKKKFYKKLNYNILSDKDILNNIYEVYAIVSFNFKEYYILYINDCPRYIRTNIFTIVDDSIPSNWVYRTYNKKYTIVGYSGHLSIKKFIGPKEFIDSKYFLLDFDDLTTFNKFYLWNYNVILPNPIKRELIYESQDDNYINYEVWRYNLKQIEELKSREYIKQVNGKELNTIFNDLILNKLEFSSEAIEYDFDREILTSKENYYAFISIKNSDLIINGNDDYNRYLILIIDVDALSMHVFNFIFNQTTSNKL